MPTFSLSKDLFADGKMTVIDLLCNTKLTPSKGEARRLVQQGGVSVDNVKKTDIADFVTVEDFEKGNIIVKKGKKVFLKVTLD